MTDPLKKKTVYGIVYGAGPAKLRAILAERLEQSSPSRCPIETVGGKEAFDAELAAYRAEQSSD